MHWRRVVAPFLIGVVAAACGTATLLPSGKVLFVLGAAMQLDAATGAVTLVGTPDSARVFHTATVISDGRVLLAGGIGRQTESGGVDVSGDGVTVATVEIYDPNTSSLTPTGSMATPRALHAATLLADGRVLVAGGGELDMSSSEGNPPLASAEIWDPKTGLFTPVGDMTTGRSLATATLLPDGHVLVAGGAGDGATGQEPTASAELFDPSTGTFTPTGGMTGPRMLHTATSLDDARVLIVGGVSSGEFSDTTTPPLGTTEIYDPATGAFTASGDLLVPRGLHTATRLDNGTVLVAGGSRGQEALASAELFDPGTGTFTAAGDMTAPRTLHLAVRLADGRVLIVFGENMTGSTDMSQSLVTIDIFDPSSRTFSSLPITGLPSPAPTPAP